MSWRTTRATLSRAEHRAMSPSSTLGRTPGRLVVYSYDADPPTQWWKRTDELYESRFGSVRAWPRPACVSDAAWHAGLETLGIFARFCHASGLGARTSTSLRPARYVTPATRDAFLRQVRDASGYDVEVLSREAEAHYGYVAALNSTTLADGS